MSLAIREIQRRQFIGLQVLVGPEGLSALDLDIGPGSGTVTWALSTDTTGVAPANPLQAYGVAQTEVNSGTNKLTLQMTVAQPLPAGWVTIAFLETNALPGDAAFESPKAVTKALDSAGASILSSVLDLSAVPPKFKHVPLSSAQLAEAGLLDDMLGQLGLSQSDSLAQHHFSNDPKAPEGPFGSKDAPVINANLNWEEMTRLLTAGLLARAHGANADKMLLTEAGKRSAGFPL